MKASKSKNPLIFLQINGIKVKDDDDKQTWEEVKQTARNEMHNIVQNIT